MKLPLLSLVLIFAGLTQAQAQTSSLCPGGEAPVGVTIAEGNYSPPADLIPDVQNTTGNTNPQQLLDSSGNPSGYLNNVGLVQWHKLDQAQQPLTLTCHYLSHPDTITTLPATTSTCSFDGQARTLNCQ